MKLHNFMMRYTFGLHRAIKSYCNWAESQAKNQTDLFLLVVGPILVFGLVLWLLPAWLGKTIALILLAPALYFVYLAIKTYRDRR